MQLRDYQHSIVSGVEECFADGDTRLCIVAPCGSGKTVIAAYLTQQALDNDNRVLFFVHRKELIEQTAATFARFNIPFGVISGDSPRNYHFPVQIASVQTIVNRLDAFEPNLIICDEAHHILASSCLKIIDHWKEARLIGLTATPERTGGIRLGDVFQKLVFGPSVRQLIQQRQLAPFDYFSPDDLDFSDIKVVAGDFAANQAAVFMSDKKIIGSIVANYRDKADLKQAICYCVNIEHSKLMAGKFNDAGIPAAQCDADTPKAQREDIINKFRQGIFKILCNVNLFGEGFDVPGVDAVILARPTKSRIVYIQQAMRAMRINPNDPDKKAIIIDHVNNVKRFGLPDEDYPWSLDPNKPKEFKPAPTKTCPECKAVVFLGTRICPHCGFEFDFEQDLTEQPGRLVKTVSTPNQPAPKFNILDTLKHWLQTAKWRGNKDYWGVCQALKFAKSFDDCKAIGAFMKYQPGWAWHQWQDIKAKRFYA